MATAYGVFCVAAPRKRLWSLSVTALLAADYLIPRDLGDDLHDD